MKLPQLITYIIFRITIYEIVRFNIQMRPYLIKYLLIYIHFQKINLYIG